MTPMDQDADARLTALFAQAARAPMGDEAFTRSVMGGVRRVEAQRRSWLQAGLVSAGALGAVAVVTNAGDLVGIAADLVGRYAAAAPQLGAGGLTLIITAAAASLGLIAAKR